jgi:hypothetical protein
MANRSMRKFFLCLGSLSFTLALAASGCAPEVFVEVVQEDPNQAQPSSDPNPYSPTTPRPSGEALDNVVAPGAPGNCNGTEVHVVGIYDPYDSASNAQGPAHVYIDRPGPVTLVLSSYSATNWTVTAGPATQLVSIVAHAYESVTVNGPAGVPVETWSAEQTGQFLGCGYEYPDTDPYSGCETPELLAAIEQHLGQPILSFHGCYAASDFVIGANLVSTSNCATEMGYAHTSFVSTSCTTPPPAPPGPEGDCIGQMGVGHYEGFICDASMYPNGGPFIITENISCLDALANCMLNAEANAGYGILCTWNGEPIHSSGVQSGTCGQ